jgi:hypothetical protein
MPRATFLLFFFILSCIAAPAQVKLLHGFMKDASTHLPIAGGTLANPATKKTIQTDAKGFFSLPVSPGDLLYTIAVDYNNDTIRYQPLFQDTITIYLAAVNTLENVTVASGYQKYQADSSERRLAFEEARGQTLHTIDRSSYKPYFGLTINLDRLLKRKYRNKQKDEGNFKRMEEYAYIKYRYTPQLVASYTGLKGEELIKFMQLYTPSYDWLRKHLLKEQVLDYLSEKIAHYRRSKQPASI